MQWSEEQKAIILKYRGSYPTNFDVTNNMALIANLQKIPKNERKYKCITCCVIFDEKDFIDGKCPDCGATRGIELMCPLDHCNCEHRRPTQGIENCPICGQPICPRCGSHDVYQISRVTGYLQDVSGWNNGKRQELIDRHRTNIEDLR